MASREGQDDDSEHRERRNRALAVTGYRDEDRMTEREAYEQLLERYGAARARQLLGTVRLLSLYGRDTVLGRQFLASSTLYADLAALREVGIAEPVEAVSAGQIGAAVRRWAAPLSVAADTPLAQHIGALLAPFVDDNGLVAREGLSAIEGLMTQLLQSQLHQQLRQLYGPIAGDPPQQ